MLTRVPSYIGIFFLSIISLLPLSVLYLFATIVYWAIFYIFKYRRKVVRTNLLNAFPEKSETEINLIEKQFYKYLAALIFEIIKMASISQAELQRRFTFKNIDLMNSHFERGQSVLVCSAHYGNWEWGTLAIGLLAKAQINPIYKPLSNKVFDQWFLRIRSRFGNHMVSMRQTYRELSRTANEITVFCFGNDQAPPYSEMQVWRQFLNQQTSIQLGMEKIAIKTNRPVFYIKVSVIKKGYYEVDCVPLCLNPRQSTIEEITELHVRLLENIIREQPQYWLWSHKRWKHQPAILLPSNVMQP